jgi:hypothetical protein
MHDHQTGRHHTVDRPYQPPRVARFGTFREITREGFTGTLDGGLILGPDGSTTPAADPARPGSR